MTSAEVQSIADAHVSSLTPPWPVQSKTIANSRWHAWFLLHTPRAILCSLIHTSQQRLELWIAKTWPFFPPSSLQRLHVWCWITKMLTKHIDFLIALSKMNETSIAEVVDCKSVKRQALIAGANQINASHKWSDFREELLRLSSRVSFNMGADSETKMIYVKLGKTGLKVRISNSNLPCHLRRQI